MASPKEFQIARRIPKALGLAHDIWHGSLANYSNVASAPIIAELAAYISSQLGSCFSDQMDTLTPKEKQVTARIVRALTMASNLWEHREADIAPNCGDIARASAIAKLAIQIAKELEGFYPPTL